MLQERGITEETAAEFGVGFPDPAKSRSNLRGPWFELRSYGWGSPSGIEENPVIKKANNSLQTKTVPFEPSETSSISGEGYSSLDDNLIWSAWLDVVRTELPER